MNRRVGWKCVMDGGGRRVFVRVEHADVFRKLANNYQRSYYWTQLYRAFASLKAEVGTSRLVDKSGTIRLLTIEGGEIEYYLDNGDVLVNRLQFGSVSKSLGSGLYPAKYSQAERGWLVDVTSSEFNLDSKWNGVHYAAIADDAGNKDKAATYMANQLFMAYSKDVHKKTIESMDSPPSFSLYCLAREDYKNPSHGERVAALIQNAADNNKPVNWLVQGSGAVTFKNAMASLKALSSLNTLKKSSATQEVFFSSPVGAHVADLDALAQEAGLKRHGKKGYNLNPFNLQSSYVSGNAFAEIAMAGRLSAAAGDGKLKQVSKSFSAALNNPVLGVGLAGAGLAAGAAGLVSQATAKTLGAFFAVRTGLNVAKGTQTIVDGFGALRHSNVGTGRYFFYESPSQLMESIKSSKSLMELK